MSGNTVKLYFVCPDTKRGYWSDTWEVAEDLRVDTSPDGQRRLQGTVHVPCPICAAVHAYRPDELACPFEAGSGGEIEK